MYASNRILVSIAAFHCKNPLTSCSTYLTLTVLARNRISVFMTYESWGHLQTTDMIQHFIKYTGHHNTWTEEINCPLLNVNIKVIDSKNG